ncbi:MAG: succinate dehydrogenase, cytochrome b556 subunit, partial [Alphaproteobacteria bacterium]|nr:succinate dehydrogenase, cytochrome b556 subunit [Alphaproteobacteria bacterium]
SAWYGQVVLFCVTVSVFMHAASGLRHFVLDIGAGYELDTNKLWSVLSPLIGIVLALAFWAVPLLR